MKSVEEIVEAANRLREGAPEVPPHDLPPGKHTPGEPDWHPIEHSAWALGERIRQALGANPRLKKAPEVLEAIIAVVECRSLRRGRQSFLLCLAFKGAAPLAGKIAPFLEDKDVCGHTLSALARMRVPGYSIEVEPLLEARHAWVRKLAKQYLDRYPADA